MIDAQISARSGKFPFHPSSSKRGATPPCDKGGQRDFLINVSTVMNVSVWLLLISGRRKE
jgi:hypothetical protein